MKKIRIGLACAAALAAHILAGPMAHAGSVAGFGGATEITQLANNLEMVNQSVMQMRMVEMQLKNLANLQLPSWNQSAPLLQNLISVVRGAQGVAWQGEMADQNFKRVYGQATGYAGTIGQQMGVWRQQSMSSTSAALRAAGMQAENFQTEAMAMQSLRDLNDRPDGQLQAIKAGSSIAAAQVDQLQQLRALQIAQIQMQAAHYSEQSAVKSRERGNGCKAEAAFFGRVGLSCDGSDTN